MKQSIGEAAITPQHMQAITPDIVSPQGLGQLSQVMQTATSQKSKLDSILKSVASSMKADFSSRIKNPETVVQKIAQKRLDGRDYGLGDVNDLYGARMVMQNKSKFQEAVKQIQKLSKAGDFTVLKKENVKDGTYSATHIDIQVPGGIKGEIQLMVPTQEAESLLNHDTRAVYGDKPPPQVQALQDLQAKKAKSLQGDVAHSLAQKIVQVHKASGDKPLPPVVNAALLSQAS